MGQISNLNNSWRRHKEQLLWNPIGKPKSKSWSFHIFWCNKWEFTKPHKFPITWNLKKKKRKEKKIQPNNSISMWKFLWWSLAIQYREGKKNKKKNHWFLFWKWDKSGESVLNLWVIMAEILKYLYSPYQSQHGGLICTKWSI